ncbi:uncharacterized protein MELLADRAFT_63623 [Melampsora larici-populina 98AG31]|uniref:Uncharacterized protein n=1 Tax=Melampsora larici-populina (strain 98AG31 / pathotype 3-4-7) TaxID=747676 RepID=F4RNC4_MELLP|nr:uncharacterized protein MELLADRAFT_63623 [Melampsora larici-populina 98AG31]EGG06121.1 hypothetical protein MELLADRAFT_63623 [Melampsora larici-populina 98AG31]
MLDHNESVSLPNYPLGFDLNYPKVDFTQQDMHSDTFFVVHNPGKELKNIEEPAHGDLGQKIHHESKSIILPTFAAHPHNPIEAIDYMGYSKQSTLGSQVGNHAEVLVTDNLGNSIYPSSQHTKSDCPIPNLSNYHICIDNNNPYMDQDRNPLQLFESQHSLGEIAHNLKSVQYSVGPEMEAEHGYNSKKRKICALNAEKTNHENASKKLSAETTSAFTDDSVKNRGKHSYQLWRDDRTSQGPFSENDGSNSILQNNLRELHNTPNHIKSFCEARISYGSRDQFYLLQKIGIIQVNRSSNLCYEIFDAFYDIYEKMKLRFGENPKAIKAAALAVKNAGYAIVMVFLGILRVFEAEIHVKDDLEILLTDGWQYMKSFFETWKNVEVEDLGLGRATQFTLQLFSDPKFHLKYLKDIKSDKNISCSLVHLLSLDWAEKTGRSRIPKGKLSPYSERILEIYKTDSNLIEGGLYERMGIRNEAFWGPEQFSRSRWHLHGEEEALSQNFIALSSNAAQFHTPIGREMCRDVHTFFEELIHDIKSHYDLINGNHTSSGLPPQSLKHLALMTRAVSMAEYKVTPVYIGMIKILNQKHLTESQLQKLLLNAWKFLKEVFSQWRMLNLQNKHLKCSYNYKSSEVNPVIGFDDPNAMFWSLAGFRNKNLVPRLFIVYLLNSWKKEITEGSQGYIGFPVQDIPSGSIVDWNLNCGK